MLFRSTSISLFAIQIQQISEFKLHAGEQQLRKAIRQVLEHLKGPQLLDSTIHTDVLWLSVSATDAFWLPKLQRALLEIQQQLPDRPAMRIWQGHLASLLGHHWQEADLDGLRELIWYSWQQKKAEPAQLLHFTVKATQTEPCSWQADNLRQDISNALTLGLLTLHYKPLA